MKRIFALFSSYMCLYSLLNAQLVSNANGLSYYGKGGIYTITTAVPFLRINPDARAGGMGDAGLATTADANAIYTNPSKLAFIGEDYGFSASFSPWLRPLMNNTYLASLNGYFKVKKMQTIAISARYFTPGSVQITTPGGAPLQNFMPNEFAFDVHYARVLSKYFSVGGSLRFIYSSFVSGNNATGVSPPPGIAGSGDLSWFFHKVFHENDETKFQQEFSMGMNISNLGSKMYYTSNTLRDYLPANLGLGFGYAVDFDKHHSLGAYLDFNKLLAPAPFGPYDSVHQTYYYREESAIKGIVTSFSSAPFIQELRYINIGGGLEYFYNKQYGLRAGYFYESDIAGNRQYATVGFTVKYSVATLNFSYLIPTAIIRSPFEDTLRFTLTFNFIKGSKKTVKNSGEPSINNSPSQRY